MKKNIGLYLFLLGAVLAGFFLAGSNCGQYGSGTATPATTVTTLPGQKSVGLDGVTFSWSIDGDNLLGTLEGQGTGWVAVGFNGDTMGSVGKIVIGSVSGGSHTVEIQTVSGRTHSPASGTVIASSGTEVAGVTTLSFTISLADLGLAGKIGQTISIILARHASSDDFSTQQHTNRGSTTLSL